MKLLKLLICLGRIMCAYPERPLMNYPSTMFTDIYGKPDAPKYIRISPLYYSLEGDNDQNGRRPFQSKMKVATTEIANLIQTMLQINYNYPKIQGVHVYTYWCINFSHIKGDPLLLMFAQGLLARKEYFPYFNEKMLDETRLKKQLSVSPARHFGKRIYWSQLFPIFQQIFQWVDAHRSIIGGHTYSNGAFYKSRIEWYNGLKEMNKSMAESGEKIGKLRESAEIRSREEKIRAAEERERARIASLSREKAEPGERNKNMREQADRSEKAEKIFSSFFDNQHGGMQSTAVNSKKNSNANQAAMNKPVHKQNTSQEQEMRDRVDVTTGKLSENVHRKEPIQQKTHREDRSTQCKIPDERVPKSACPQQHDFPKKENLPGLQRKEGKVLIEPDEVDNYESGRPDKVSLPGQEAPSQQSTPVLPVNFNLLSSQASNEDQRILQENRYCPYVSNQNLAIIVGIAVILLGVVYFYSGGSKISAAKRRGIVRRKPTQKYNADDEEASHHYHPNSFRRTQTFDDEDEEPSYVQRHKTDWYSDDE